MDHVLDGEAVLLLHEPVGHVAEGVGDPRIGRVVLGVRHHGEDIGVLAGHDGAEVLLQRRAVRRLGGHGDVRMAEVEPGQRQRRTDDLRLHHGAVGGGDDEVRGIRAEGGGKVDLGRCCALRDQQVVDVVLDRRLVRLVDDVDGLEAELDRRFVVVKADLEGLRACAPLRLQRAIAVGAAERGDGRRIQHRVRQPEMGEIPRRGLVVLVGHQQEAGRCGQGEAVRIDGLAVEERAVEVLRERGRTVALVLDRDGDPVPGLGHDGPVIVAVDADAAVVADEELAVPALGHVGLQQGLEARDLIEADVPDGGVAGQVRAKGRQLDQNALAGRIAGIVEHRDVRAARPLDAELRRQRDGAVVDRGRGLEAEAVEEHVRRPKAWRDILVVEVDLHGALRRLDWEEPRGVRRRDGRQQPGDLGRARHVGGEQDRGHGPGGRLAAVVVEQLQAGSGINGPAAIGAEVLGAHQHAVDIRAQDRAAALLGDGRDDSGPGIERHGTIVDPVDPDPGGAVAVVAQEQIAIPVAGLQQADKRLRGLGDIDVETDGPALDRIGRRRVRDQAQRLARREGRKLKDGGIDPVDGRKAGLARQAQCRRTQLPCHRLSP